MARARVEPGTSAPDAERRARYLDAAMRLFAEHGYVGTTMDMVIAVTGGSKATLYKHFPTKEDLITGLMQRVADTVGHDVGDPAASTRPLAEELTAIARSTCQGVWSPGAAAVLRLCLGEQGRFPELARTVWEVGPTRTYASFRALLAERRRRGEVVVDGDPQIVAEQFLGGLVGHVQLKIAFGLADPPTPAETEARIASAVQTFLARYATPPGAG